MVASSCVAAGMSARRSKQNAATIGPTFVLDWDVGREENKNEIGKENEWKQGIKV